MQQGAREGPEVLVDAELSLIRYLKLLKGFKLGCTGFVLNFKGLYGLSRVSGLSFELTLGIGAEDLRSSI